MEQDKLNRIDFDDEDTTCPKCGAYGMYIPPAVENGDGTITAKFECNNGHHFSKSYPLKEDTGND